MKAGLILVVFAAAMAYTSLRGIQALFLSRDSLEYLAVVQGGLPLLLFQATFLAFIVNLILPLFFKIYGSVPLSRIRKSSKTPREGTGGEFLFYLNLSVKNATF